MLSQCVLKSRNKNFQPCIFGGNKLVWVWEELEYNQNISVSLSDKPCLCGISFWIVQFSFAILALFSFGVSQLASSTYFCLLVLWATQLLSQWMVHWWQVHGSMSMNCFFALTLSNTILETQTLIGKHTHSSRNTTAAVGNLFAIMGCMSCALSWQATNSITFILKFYPNRTIRKSDFSWLAL